MRKLGLRHKKRTIFATEQDRPDIAVAREVWRAAQAGLDFNRLVFVDETGTTTSMTRLRGSTRLRGWGRKGKPFIGKTPHGHWMTSTFVAGLRNGGIAAPMLIDTPMTGRIFRQWLTDHLIAELAPGSIVVCDTLSGPEGRRHPRMPGGRRHGPALPAALQPRLQSDRAGPFDFGQDRLRQAENAAPRAAPRSRKAIVTALNHILERFQPAERANYLRHSRYVQT